jgi:hypothetical protein
MPHPLGSLLPVALICCLFAVGNVKAQTDDQAFAGEPFGVGKVSLRVSAADLQTLKIQGFRLTEAQNRAFFPAVNSNLLRRLWNQPNTPAGGAPRVEVWFLFTGNEPLKLELRLASSYSVQLTPESPRRPAIPQRLWRAWWREYHAAARLHRQNSSYPPVVETYLTSMLGYRLGLQPPLASRVGEQDPDELKATMELLFGTERLRYDLMRHSFSTPGVFSSQASFPVPREINWTASNLQPTAVAEVEVESIARCVPRECFYIRFGSWENQVWLKNFAEQEGADLARLISLRSFDQRISNRLQNQLAIQDSKFVDLVGGNLISDVAVMGLDTFLREGASVGVVLQAKNRLLGTGLQQQRISTQKKWRDAGAELSTVLIGGNEVSLLATPDRRLWSYYVESNSFHLVANSEALVRRFLEASNGGESLADSADFLRTRREFPLSREDSIFAYFSKEFFGHLLTPHYQIELRRRMQSVTDIEALLMAKSIGHSERLPADNLDALIQAGLLPQGFGTRPDGSGPTFVNGRWQDSRRGVRGYFVPIADMQVSQVTAEELEMFRRRAFFFEEQWPSLDPIVVALHRETVGDRGQQTLSFEARIQPFGEEKYGWLNDLLGPPMQELVRTEGDNLLTAQASVKGGLLLDTPPHRLFVTMSNRPPKPLAKAPDQWTAFDMFKNAPGYLGAWPKPGFLDLLPIGLGGQPDAFGFTRSLLGLWRWQGRGFSVLSFDPDLLAQASDNLHLVAHEEPSHLHLRVGDLGQSQMRPWLEQVRYWRAREATLGNVRLINQVISQLGVAPAEARDYTEHLLDVDLICPLGGSYRLVDQQSGGSGLWEHLPAAVTQGDLIQTRQAGVDLPLDVLDGAEVWAYKGVDQFRVWGKLGIEPRADEGESNR